MIRVLLGLMLIAGACWGDDGVKLTDGKSEVTGILPFNNPGPDYGYSAPVIGMNSERYIERIDTVWANKVPVYLSPEELKALKEILEWFKRERPDCKLGNGSEVKGILPVCNGGK